MAQTVTRQELDGQVGQPLGVSDWFLVDQARVNAVRRRHARPPVRPRRPREGAQKTPFGGTIAHGFLTLSLLVHLCLPFIPELANRKLRRELRVRQGAVLGARQSRQARPRRRLSSAEVSERKPGNVVMRIDVTVEIEGEDKPALVAEWLSLHVVD